MRDQGRPRVEVIFLSKEEMDAALNTGRRKLLLSGILMTLIGVVAFCFHFLGFEPALIGMGWILIAAGALMLMTSFAIVGTGPFFAWLLWSLISITAGVFVIANPIGGVLSLTLLVTALFMFQGAFEFYFALSVKHRMGWVWLMLSAILSTAGGILVASGAIASSEMTLNILVGADFVSTGLAFTYFAARLARR